MGWKSVAVIERWLLYRDGNVWKLCHLKLELVGCINEVTALQSNEYTEVPLYNLTHTLTRTILL